MTGTSGASPGLFASLLAREYEISYGFFAFSFSMPLNGIGKEIQSTVFVYEFIPVLKETGISHKDADYCKEAKSSRDGTDVKKDMESSSSWTRSDQLTIKQSSHI